MEKAKYIISITIIIQWILSLSIVVLLIALGLIDKNEGVDFLKSYSTVASPFVGMVMGYLFTSGK